MLNKAFYSILLRNTFHIVIVCIGVSTPSKTPPTLSCQALPSKPPFLISPSSILVFCEPSLKVGFFSELQKYQGNTILSFKVTKFLVEISWFEFLVMTEKNVFAHKPFLSLIISDFDLFLCENCNPFPPEYSHPLFHNKPPLKVEVLSSPPPLFLKILMEVTPPPPEQKGVGVHYDCLTTLNHVHNSQPGFLFKTKNSLSHLIFIFITFY